MIIIVMGVAGSGKTTLGEMLAARLGCGFSDADDFHPVANVEKMRAGIPLTDEDRAPWLAALRAAIDGWQGRGESRIIACSALREAYRGILSPAGDVVFVYLKGSAEVIAARLAARRGHYMNPTLLTSQFATLEEPTGAVVVDIEQPPVVIVEAIAKKLAALGNEAQEVQA